MTAGINKFPWKEGANTLLPVGSYAIGMGTNCDSGSIAGQTGMVTTSGGNNVVSWAFGPYFDTTGSWNGTSIYIGNPTRAYTIGSVSSQTSLTVTRNINKVTQCCLCARLESRTRGRELRPRAWGRQFLRCRKQWEWMEGCDSVTVLQGFRHPLGCSEEYPRLPC